MFYRWIAIVVLAGLPMSAALAEQEEQLAAPTLSSDYEQKLVAATPPGEAVGQLVVATSVVEETAKPVASPPPLTTALPSGVDVRCGCPVCFLNALADAPWYAEVDGMFLTRNSSRHLKLVEDGVGHGVPRGQRPELMSTNDIHFSEAVGPRVVLGRRLNDCHEFQLIYYGLFDWNGSAQVTGPNLDVPFDTDYSSDYDDAQRVRATYDSQLHNLETNWIRHRCCALVQPLLGFRYLNLNEQFDLESHEDDSGDTSDYQIWAENHLVGLQLGGLIERSVTDRFGWNFGVKAGVYDNFARQHTFMRGNNNTVVKRDFTARSSDVAFLGELGIDLAYQLSRSTSVSVGYQAMWLSGVALAPEQLDFTTTPTSGSNIDHYGSLFLHGLYVGLRIAR